MSNLGSCTVKDNKMRQKPNGKKRNEVQRVFRENILTQIACVFANLVVREIVHDK